MYVLEYIMNYKQDYLQHSLCQNSCKKYVINAVIIRVTKDGAAGSEQL